MPLRTADEYVKSLRDGRTMYLRGARVNDVTTHPVIGVAVEHAATDYRLADAPRHRVCVWSATSTASTRDTSRLLEPQTTS